MNRDPLFQFRGTGRTHRMLEEAVSLMRQKKQVFIIRATSMDSFHLSRMLYELCPDLVAINERRFGCADGGNIEFVNQSDVKWDWRSLRLTGVGQDAAILIDHYAIEFAYGHLIHAWVKYVQ